MGCEAIVTDELSSHVDADVDFRVNNHGLLSARKRLDAIQLTCELPSDALAMGSLVDRSPSPLH